MAKDYKLSYVKIDKEPYKDKFGNTWLSVSFDGISEPIKWVVKDPKSLRVGDSYYGEIRDETSQAGKAYRRFHRVQRDEGQTVQGSTANHTPSSPKSNWQPRDDSHIRAQWAIGQAVSVYNSTDSKKPTMDFVDSIETLAKQFFDMVDRVKNHEQIEQNESNEDAEMRSLMDSLPDEDIDMPEDFLK